MPEGVAGIRVSGHLSGEDFDGIRTTIEEAVQAGEIRIVEAATPNHLPARRVTALRAHTVVSEWIRSWLNLEDPSPGPPGANPLR
jgi:hypothetical protein